MTKAQHKFLGVMILLSALVGYIGQTFYNKYEVKVCGQITEIFNPYMTTGKYPSDEFMARVDFGEYGSKVMNVGIVHHTYGVGTEFCKRKIHVVKGQFMKTFPPFVAMVLGYAIVVIAVGAYIVAFLINVFTAIWKTLGEE